MSLSIFCVTKAEPHAAEFLAAMVRLSRDLGAQLVLGADGPAASRALQLWQMKAPSACIVEVASKGYLESVHDEVLANCTGDYVFRLDDDECCSPALLEWLQKKEYEASSHWKFARAALWGGTDTFIHSPKLYPDPQTRLSIKSLAGGRDHIHAGSPFGAGLECPAMIEHHSFLIRTLEERRLKAAHYESIKPGAGSGEMLAFQCPEDVYDDLPLAPLFDGLVDRPRPVTLTKVPR